MCFYSFFISSIDKPVTDAIWSCDKPMDNKFFAVSSLAFFSLCDIPRDSPIEMPYFIPSSRASFLPLPFLLCMSYIYASFLCLLSVLLLSCLFSQSMWNQPFHAGCNHKITSIPGQAKSNHPPLLGNSVNVLVTLICDLSASQDLACRLSIESRKQIYSNELW